MFYKKKISLSIVFYISATTYPICAVAESYSEFDPVFLSQQHVDNVIDISAFNQGNPVYPGIYTIDIYVNDKWLGQAPIKFVENPDDSNNANLCINQSLIRKLDIDLSTLPQYVDKAIITSETCLTKDMFPKDVTFKYQSSDLRLNAVIAQAYLIKRPKGYIDPELWETGVNSAFVSYRANHYENKYKNSDDNRNSYINVFTGINIGNWHLRHSGNYLRTTYDGSSYDSYETYLQRDLPRWRSQLKLGDVSTSDALFHNNTLRGMQLRSDDRMLPASMRGFAPVIRGLANTNALVKVKQNGREIYNITVSPGPFTIDDVYPTGQNGELVVTVNESDGVVKEFTVPYFGATELIRPGINRFEWSVGAIRENNHVYNEKGTQFSWSRGINNYFKSDTGFILAKNYQSFLLGGSVTTPMGALSLDATHAKSHFDDEANASAQRYRLYYNKQLPAILTNIYASASHHTKNGFYSWKDVAEVNEPSQYASRQDFLSSLYRIKNEYQANITQGLPWDTGNLYASIYHRLYWNDKRKENSWSAGYSNHWRALQYNLSVNNTKYSNDNKWRKEWMFSFSIPLGNSVNRPYFQATYNRSQNNKDNINLGLSGSLGEENQYHYALNAQKYDKNKSYTGSLAADTQLALLSSSYSHQRNTSQWSMGASGGVVVHSGGITAANELGDTFAIVHAKGATGAKVSRGRNVRLDRWGYAIVPYLSPYEINMIDIDPKGLPLDVELTSTKQEVIPKANSSTFVEMKTSFGTPLLLQLELPDGNSVPVGASVFNNEELIGMATNGGRIFTRSLDSTGTLIVKWGSEAQQCQAPYNLNKDTIVQLNNQIRLLTLTCTITSK